MSNEVASEGLALLRKPFEARHISKLPKPTKAQTEAVRNDYKVGIRCDLCGAWHHPKVVHLDYVGHAALTDRLLDADPAWYWEPVATHPNGGPILDENGGMWIRLTVCGVTRLGYGDAQGKIDANAMKERIGDALRNAAMRFGAALDLWHKGELHSEDYVPPAAPQPSPVVDQPKAKPKTAPPPLAESPGLEQGVPADRADGAVPSSAPQREMLHVGPLPRSEAPIGNQHEAGTSAAAEPMQGEISPADVSKVMRPSLSDCLALVDEASENLADAMPTLMAWAEFLSPADKATLHVTIASVQGDAKPAEPVKLLLEGQKRIIRARLKANNKPIDELIAKFGPLDSLTFDQFQEVQTWASAS